MRLQYRRRGSFTRLPMIALVSKGFEMQVSPNPYIRFGGYDLALDLNGFLVTTPRRHFGYIRKAGWHGGRS